MAKVVIDIPDRLVHFAPHLQFFFQLQIFKLSINSHKDNQNPEAHPKEMLTLLEGECKELREAVFNRKQEDMAFEAADVANMAFLTHFYSQKKSKDSL